ncbi:glutamate--cysteine ligase [Saccharicrinis carchari]|uniref:Glutamate--cysteine ligase n=1 Tax=Saccharicrinis carchari TaxID=1168039 RepID=A0A521B2H3_SACCC|nr:glutamate--cysteine ligase [Saccharicrinis carchari]SMO41235.1 glutamate--cysteine ligase [Saccharicrinis carchari]
MTKKENPLEIQHKSQLIDYFEQGNKAPENWGIGTEHEKFLYDSKSFKRLSYDQKNGINTILNHMQRYGWQPVEEKGKVIALQNSGASITLEPGGQFELSGENFRSVHETFQETRRHFEELYFICNELDTFTLPLGVDPLTALEEVPWMPKERYGWMKNYMPTKGDLGLQMMTNTACIQVNLDYASEADMVKKMRVAQALQPVVTAIFANSPFAAGKPNGFLSQRAHIWDRTDPDRCGFLPFIFDDGFGFERWVDYLLDVPMYFIYRDDKYLSANGLTFGQFLKGKHVLQPTMEDWETHVSTVFPDVRLKQFIEMRGADASCVHHIAALSALWVGLVYDKQSLEEAHHLISGWNLEALKEVRLRVPKEGLNAKSGAIHIGEVAKQIYQIALAGLNRRSEKTGIENESRFLAPVRQITDSGITQAEKYLQRYNKDCNKDISKLVTAWLVDQTQIYPYKHEV